MNRAIIQWQLLLGLLAVGWGINKVSAALAWAQQHLLLIFLLLAAFIALLLVLAKSTHLGRGQEQSDSRESQKAAEIKEAIRVTPKLSRYAWSENSLELFKQWEKYKSTGVTPVRHKTLARRNRAKTRNITPQVCPPVESPLIWKGEMRCNNCQYLWQSRRSSPPARCPKCNSKNLTALRERSPQ